MVSLEHSILKRVMILLLIGWTIILVSVYTLMIETKKSKLTELTNDKQNSLKIERFNSLFFSKSSQVANAMQSFITDNQIYKILV